MFLRIADLLKAKVLFDDGLIEICQDVLFDETDFGVRYLTVAANDERGNGSKVLATSSSVRLNRRKKTINVKMTSEALHDGPSVVTLPRRPRESEEIVSEFFGTPYYWVNVLDGGESAITVLNPPETRVSDTSPPWLQSAGTLAGYRPVAVDGLAGQMHDLVFTGNDWRMKYIALNNGDNSNKDLGLIPVAFIDRIFWLYKKVKFTLTRSQLAGVPILSSGAKISPDYERSIEEYFKSIPAVS